MTHNFSDFGDLPTGAKMFENPYSPVFIKNPKDDKIVDVNKAALDVLKASRQDFLKQDFRTIINKYFEKHSFKKLKQDGRLYSVDQIKIDREGLKLDQITLKPVTVIYTEDSKAFLRKMSKVLIHRLRSPITGMMGFADLIDNDADETTHRYLEKIRTGLNDVANSLNRIEKLSREIVVQKTPFNTKDIINDVLSDFSPLQQKRIHYKVKEDEVIETDYVLLKSILYELIKNGLENGSESDIHIYSPSKGKFQVINHGKVIPIDIASKIFFPFFTLKARNSGLGLTISQLRAEAMGASLKLVENSADEGIIFELDISL